MCGGAELDWCLYDYSKKFSGNLCVAIASMSKRKNSDELREKKPSFYLKEGEKMMIIMRKDEGRRWSLYISPVGGFYSEKKE